ncbi:hypothetical protein N789_09265 [Arenimonas oryziterrae DSM 21050 = YC6267]|uniref:Potassium channel domain-containing protein n=2 Tax=Arenimonas TaxID=490567 RepID=A0A091AXW3_9GAMM|nr:hypothetical protein N789_09265 [Arenimonas oryziterrae DSM 21050 = YC6267]
MAKKKPFLQFERRHEALLAWPAFFRRLMLSAAIGFGLILVSLAVGMLGYHGTEGLDWLDSFLNASMILSGMGPLWDPRTDGGKIFAGIYALYSGLMVLAIAGVTFAPMIHRVLHAFHAESDNDPS